MDLFDLFPIVPPSIPDPTSGERAPGAQLVGALAAIIFPAIDFVLVLFGDLYIDFALAIAALPLFFAAIAGLISQRIGTTTGITVRVTLTCLLMCLVASGAAILLGTLMAFYSDF